MHSIGIYHRDIKPENIVFDKDLQRAKFIDFGIAADAKVNLNEEEDLQRRFTTRAGTIMW